MKKTVLGAFLAVLGLFGPPIASPQQGSFNSACFHGLNDIDSAATLNPCDAQDLLNTESNLQGTAVLKRRGYSLSATLTCSTCPINGSHSFVNTSGSRIDIVCYQTSCESSTNGNAFSVFYTTGSSGITRWSFVDVGGAAYGGNNKYDPIMKWDGTNLTHPSGMPQGSILEMTEDRMVIGDITGNPNRVHYSSAGAFTTFTTGVNSEDSFFDDIGAAGDKIRGLKYFKGNLYIFKTASITSCQLEDQYNTLCVIILPNLGTTDPASIITAGDNLYFRGQDKNYWEITNNGIRQISSKIAGFVGSQGGGVSGGEQSNTQTTQTDWGNGSQKPSGTFDSTSISGSIFPSSVTFIDTSTNNFAAGTLTAISTTVAGEISLFQTSTNSYINAGAESNSNTINVASRVQWTNNPVQAGFEANAFGSRYWDSATSESCDSNKFLNFYILDTSSNVLKSSAVVMSASVTGAFVLDTSTLPAHMIKLRVTWGTTTEHDYISVPFIRSNGLAIRYANLSGSLCTPVWDVQEGGYVTSGNIISQVFDTAFTTPTYGPFNVDFSSTANQSVTFEVQSASSAFGSFESLISITPGNGITSTKRHIRYKGSFSVTSATDTPAIINLASIKAATTGQFIVQCIQPGSSISSWGTLSCAETISGIASNVYYATSAATCAALPTSDPTSWQTSVTNNATVTIATNTAVKYAWRSLMGSATDQIQVDACTLNWTEGTAVQPSWAVYDSIKNAVYWTTTINNATSSNRLLKYDKNLDSWYPFNISAQAPKIINNSLYFGSSSTGKWYKYGGVDSDDGANIEAYWKSKDIGSDNPFLEKAFETYSLLAKNQQYGVLSSTLTFSNSMTTVFDVSMSTGSTLSYIRSNNNIGEMSPQNFISVKFGNNSSTFFEVLGFGFTWSNLPWYSNEAR